MLAAKLRERAEVIDQAVQFNRHVDLPFALQDYLSQIRRAASEGDHREIVANLDVSAPIDLTDALATGSHVQRLRDAAAELDEYATDVRKRGGIYHIEERQRIGCVVLLFTMFAGSGFLIWKSYVWSGVGVLIVTTLGVWMLIGSQREPA